MTNGLYLAFADMLHNGQADADAAERAFNVNIHPVPLGGPLVTAGDLAVL